MVAPRVNEERGGREPTALGEFIALIRAARHVTLEDVARGMGRDGGEATGSDKGYVSRVETGHIKRPEPPTVRRMARGLRLEPYEVRLALRVAGYHAWAGAALDAPDEPARQRVLEALADEWLGQHGPHLIALIDLQGTIWHVSESFARLFSGVPASALVGRHLLELCLDPTLGLAKSLAGLVDLADRDVLVRRAVSVYRLASLADGAKRWRDGVLARLKAMETFGQFWSAPEANIPMSVDGLYRLPLVGGGFLFVATLPVVLDPRFLLVTVSPSDSAAAALVESRLR